MISAIINIFYLLIDSLSMMSELCIMHVPIMRYRGTLPENPSRKIWWLGVCADLSKMLGIHLVAVKFFVLLYKPLGLGRIFYFIYYSFIKNSVFIPQLTPEHEVQIIKIKSCYLGS